jgi:hypothetical protein
LALVWIATVVLWWRGRAGKRAPQSPAPPAQPTPKSRPALRKILRDLESACAVSDPNAARQALLAYAETRFAANPPRSLGALAALLPAGAAGEVLALEAHIYGAGAGVWRGAGLKAMLAELETAALATESTTADPLLPLYR